MRFKYDTKIYDELNLTPLMDLAWTLLIIFIVMATATVQGIAVDLPKASSAPSLAKPRTKAVTITADGRIYLDTVGVSLAELEAGLAAAKAADPNLPVVVKGDAGVQYQRVIEVLDVVRRCPGLRIEVAGHTDSDGSDVTNQQLSDARARSVAEYLIANGVEAAVETLFQAAAADPEMSLLPWLEKEFTQRAMQQSGQNQVKAAKMLGITRATLRKRLERNGTEPEEE